MVYKALLAKDYSDYVVHGTKSLAELRRTAPAYAHVLEHRFAIKGHESCANVSLEPQLRVARCSMDRGSPDLLKLFQTSDHEVVQAARLALALAAGECGSTGRVRDVVLSTVSSAQEADARVLREALGPELRVHIFDSAAWVGVWKARVPGWDPSEQLMLDVAELEVWVQAAVFVASGSTMSKMALWRRHALRGVHVVGAPGRSRACNVFAQPCAHLPNYWRLSGAERLRCSGNRTRWWASDTW